MRRISFILIFLIPLLGYTLPEELITNNYIFFKGLILNKTSKDVYDNMLRNYHITNFDSVSIIDKEYKEKTIITKKENTLFITIMTLLGKKIRQHTIVFTNDSICETMYSFYGKETLKHPTFATAYFYKDSIRFIVKEFEYSAYRVIKERTFFINHSKIIAECSRYVFHNNYFDKKDTTINVTSFYCYYYQSDTSDNVILKTSEKSYKRNDPLMNGATINITPFYDNKSDSSDRSVLNNYTQDHYAAIITIDTIDSKIKFIYINNIDPWYSFKHEFDLKTKKIISAYSNEYSFYCQYSADGEVLRDYIENYPEDRHLIYLYFYEGNGIKKYRIKKTKKNKLKEFKLVETVNCYITSSGTQAKNN